MASHVASADRFRIVGGMPLNGQVVVTGAKNSVLKLMAASLLAPGKTVIRNVPAIADVEIMSELLTRLGCTIESSSGVLTIDVPTQPEHRADYDLVRKMRASINVLGPLVARVGKAEVALPGGDAIGSRGLDFHIKGLEILGANAHIEHGYVVAKADKGLTGASVDLDFPSVGATENIMTAAVLARGVTTIENAAREPDIVDLGEFLISMGAKIQGLGTSVISITGVEKLSPTDHTTVADRIITGTWAFAVTMTGGDISILGARPEHLELPLEKLASAGAVITSIQGGIRVRMNRRPQSIDVATLPYPGFPTDLLPMVIALNSIADGHSLVTENVFESRFMFVNELIRLGAQINVDGHHASITGVKELSGAPVEAHDIRAGAGLILAALVADGETTVDQAFHVDRGYPNFTQQLQELGAKMVRE
jgi:UDP-N-acetylglucosamine 1-carboxyvinyltransferase